LDDGQDIDVGRRNLISNISVDEDLTGSESHDFIGGHSGVGASNPQKLRSLGIDQSGEELWISFNALFGPLPVVVDDKLVVGAILVLLGRRNLSFLLLDLFFLFLHFEKIIFDLEILSKLTR
jgi:hypothetical protein